jgi:hypothetical protein
MFFDATRTWLVVKALITSPHAEVQYLFLSHSLKELVMTHAANSGEKLALLERASQLMRQPGRTSPHNDHLHLRIFCSDRDVRGGCVNTGAVHPWTNLYEGARKDQIDKTLRHLDDPRADARKRSLERLVLLNDREHAAQLSALLADRKAAVRIAAARALAALGGPDDADQLVDRFRVESDLDVRVALIHATSRVGGARAGHFLAEALGEPIRETGHLLGAVGAAAEVGGPALFSLLPETGAALFGSYSSASERESDRSDTDPLASLFAWAHSGREQQRTLQRAAVAASATSEQLEPAPMLIGLLYDREPELRAAAADSLRVLTNLSYGIDWLAGDDAALDRGRRQWRNAWAASKTAPRSAWLKNGFLHSGFKVPELTHQHMWEIIRAISGPDHVSYNAQRVLARLTDHEPPTLDWSKGAACRHWINYVRSRRAVAEPPPKRVESACFGTRR